MLAAKDLGEVTGIGESAALRDHRDTERARGQKPFCLRNRLRVFDLRMLCGATACHSDILKWQADDPVESAALQLLQVLYSVPQLSVLLDPLPADHQAILRFWVPWWIAHRTTLLDGTLNVAHPEHEYTRAAATTAAEHIASAYISTLIPLVDRPYIAVMNATRSPNVIVACEHALGRRQLRVRDCCGKILEERTLDFTAGIHVLAIPAAGLAKILG